MKKIFVRKSLLFRFIISLCVCMFAFFQLNMCYADAQNQRNASSDKKPVVNKSDSGKERVYILGKPVDQKVVDGILEQFKKSSPMAAQQLENPKIKKDILQSIGMQQAILLKGNADKLQESASYKNKLEEIKPMIYVQIMQDNLEKQPIAEKDILDKYEAMKNEAKKQQQYEPMHILVKDEKTAKQVIDELNKNKGDKFEELAKKYSTDTGSKEKGGDLGFSDLNSFVPEFSNAVKALKKGEYTKQAVKSQFGYHVIKLKDVKMGATVPSFATIKDQIKAQLQGQKMSAFFEGLKNEYQIEVK